MKIKTLAKTKNNGLAAPPPTLGGNRRNAFADKSIRNESVKI
jgi:hypothetical protein